MAGKNIHNEPFDDETLLKLDIFHKYLKACLPVFINYPYSNDSFYINIVDFFAGQGKDVTNKPGSPVIILETVKHELSKITTKNKKVRIILNELDKDKFSLLQELVNSEYAELKNKIEIILENKTFEDCYKEHKSKFTNSANFIFLDQNGIKEITETVFNELINMRITDILFFISSSFLYRFRDLDEFKKYLQTEHIPFDDNNFHKCHRAVYEFYKSKISRNKPYYLAPFSLKKASSVYGLIFGSNHTYGLEKFLKICWNIDPQRGEANYDIDGDKINPASPSLFQEFNVPKKTQVFEKDLAEYIAGQGIHKLKDIYTFGLDKGFQPSHVKNVLVLLQNEGKIELNCKLITSKIHQIKDTETITNLLWHNQA